MLISFYSLTALCLPLGRHSSKSGFTLYLCVCVTLNVSVDITITSWLFETIADTSSVCYYFAYDDIIQINEQESKITVSTSSMKLQFALRTVCNYYRACDTTCSVMELRQTSELLIL